MRFTKHSRVRLHWGDSFALGSIEGPLPERLNSTKVEVWRIGADRPLPPAGTYVHEGNGTYRLEDT